MLRNVRARLRHWLTCPDPFLIRSILGLALITALLALLGWAGYYGFKECRRMVLTHHARTAEASGDTTRFLGFIRQVLESHPDDLEANRLMVDFCKRSAPRSYVEWLTRLQGLEPDNRKTSLELAGVHLRLKHYENASTLARSLIPYREWSGPAHNILALTSAHRGDLDAALEHFRSALRDEPNSLPILANFATFLTTLHQPSLDAEREDILLRLSRLPGGDLAVLRLRGARAMEMRDAATSLELAQEIVRHPRHQFGDRLQHLGTLLAFRPADYPAALKVLQESSRQQRSTMGPLLEWLLHARRWEEAMAWMDAFPPEIQSSTHIRFTRIQCAVLARWPASRWLPFLGTTSWGRDEPLRLAGLSMAHQMDGQADAAISFKRRAVESAKRHSLSCYSLLDLVEAWEGWDEEVDSLLESLSHDRVFESQALGELFQRHLAKRNAAKLLPIAERLALAHPESPQMQGNYLSLALLLDPGSPKIRSACEKFFLRYSRLPHAQSLQGFALTLSGKAGEGLNLMERIAPELRQLPPINLYYAFALSRNNRAAEAGAILKLVDESRLLDAEKLILAEARNASAH
ncbi:MAG: hypothetical protein SFU85_09490 [Candidatus Methylacidiphilales bacterium]|nr:hypothetical protein [Candidatus Methylacidiphilales bacterium]